MTNLNPMVFELQAALVECGIMDDEQAKVFIDTLEASVRRNEDEEIERRAKRREQFEQLPWYKKFWRDRYRYVAGY